MCVFSQWDDSRRVLDQNEYHCTARTLQQLDLTLFDIRILSSSVLNILTTLFTIFSTVEYLNATLRIFTRLCSVMIYTEN